MKHFIKNQQQGISFDIVHLIGPKSNFDISEVTPGFLTYTRKDAKFKYDIASVGKLYWSVGNTLHSKWAVEYTNYQLSLSTLNKQNIFNDNSCIYFDNFESSGSIENSKFGTKSFKSFGEIKDTGIPQAVNQTVSFWYNIDNDSYGAGMQSDQYGIIGANTKSSGFSITKYGNGNSYQAGVVTDTGDWIGGNIPSIKHVWNHIVFVLGTNNTKIYVNGTLMYSGTSALSPYDNIILGTGNNAIEDKSGFGGYIDQVRIFNRALTQAEVTTVYNEH